MSTPIYSAHCVHYVQYMGEQTSIVSIISIVSRLSAAKLQQEINLERWLGTTSPHIVESQWGHVTGIYWSQAGNSEEKNTNQQIAREYCQRDSNMESPFGFYNYQPKLFSWKAVDWNYGKYHQKKQHWRWYCQHLCRSVPGKNQDQHPMSAQQWERLIRIVCWLQVDSLIFSSFSYHHLFGEMPVPELPHILVLQSRIKICQGVGNAWAFMVFSEINYVSI